MSKIYLVRGISRESYDNTTVTLDAFTSKELAEKVANGFEDVEDNLIAIWEVKKKEQNERIADLDDDATEDEYDAIYAEYEQYDVYWTFFYSVQEIDLIT